MYLGDDTVVGGIGRIQLDGFGQDGLPFRAVIGEFHGAMTVAYGTTLDEALRKALIEHDRVKRDAGRRRDPRQGDIEDAIAAAPADDFESLL